jgi:hypothetical protein
MYCAGAHLHRRATRQTSIAISQTWTVYPHNKNVIGEVPRNKPRPIPLRPHSPNFPHYATIRKVAGSIPDEVTGFFNCPNSSSRTMALGSTQPLTDMSNRILQGGRRVGLTTLPPSASWFCKEYLGASMSHNLMGLHGLSHGWLDLTIDSYRF